MICFISSPTSDMTEMVTSTSTLYLTFQLYDHFKLGYFHFKVDTCKITLNGKWPLFPSRGRPVYDVISANYNKCHLYPRNVLSVVLTHAYRYIYSCYLGFSHKAHRIHARYRYLAVKKIVQSFHKDRLCPSFHKDRLWIMYNATGAATY